MKIQELIKILLRRESLGSIKYLHDFGILPYYANKAENGMQKKYFKLFFIIQCLAFAGIMGVVTGLKCVEAVLEKNSFITIVVLIIMCFIGTMSYILSTYNLVFEKRTITNKS